MIKNVHCAELRQIIAETIAPTIETHRLTKKDQFFYEFDMEPTDDEIDEFIVSVPYFDDIIKDFLLSGPGYCRLDDENVNAFKSNVIMWAEKCIKN